MATYGPNKCTGGTASASSEHYPAADAFNGITAEDGWCATNTYSGWLQYQFAAPATIAKIKVWSGVTSWTRIFNPLYLHASNTGAFAGEQVALLNTGSLSWAQNEAKEFEFTNENAYSYYRISGTAPDIYPRIAEVEMYELVPEIEGDFTGGAGLDDAILGVSMTEYLAEAAGLGDSIDSFSLTDAFTDGAGIADAIEALKERFADSTDGAGIADAFAGQSERLGPIMDAAGIADAFDAFNWTALARTLTATIKRYYFTLTGAADGVADVILPISSFSMRRRNGESSYLSVVVPSMAYATQITARSHGTMLLEVAFLDAVGAVRLRETLMAVPLESVRTDEGARSASITLTGHLSEAWATGQLATLSGINYKSKSDAGKWTVRAEPDIYIRPGCIVSGTGLVGFTAGMVEMYATAGQQSMTIVEA